MLSSNCTACGSKNSRFTNKQEVSVVLSILRIKTPVCQTPTFDPILF